MDSSTAASRPRAGAPGDRVGGRYRLLEVIGAGGMGRVWLAEDELLQRRVAIKEIAVPDGSAAPLDDQLSTIREARAAARLDHPGVVKVFDVVWQPDRSWIVMEYVKSRSLYEAVRADGPLTHRQAARIGLAVLIALRAAHAAGVLHRDVKPHNVLLGDDGRIVLTDFGLATTGDTDGAGEPVMGSPNYVAPERLRAGPSGPAADMWSFGATLYAATEGLAPFARATTSASLTALLGDDEPRPPGRPGPLTPIIAGLLIKDPQRRSTGADVEPRLRRMVEEPAETAPVAPRIPAQRVGPDARARGIARVPPAPPVEAPRPPAVSPGSGSPPRRWRIALAGAVVAVAAAAGAAIVPDARRGDAPPDTTTAFVSTTGAVAPAPTAAGTAADLCGLATSAAPVLAATARIPSGLPTGWVWYRDPAGFAMAVPRGWLRSAGGTVVCFSDPAGRQTFAVDSTAPLTRRPLAYWQGREKAALAGGALPGYRRVNMGVLLLRQGGAEWEYTWTPDSDNRRHVRRILVTTGGGVPYRLAWTTAEADWPAGLPVQRQFVTLFQSAP